MQQSNQSSRGITLTWNYTSVSAPNKLILKDISGYCKPGEMLAIMGPSGAGKTTLLSLLANKRSQTLTIQGTTQANNRSFSAEQFYNFGAYIYQNDILHEMLTVKETLEFIARLRITNDLQAEKRVKKMISMFSLQKCQDTFVGGQFKKGISGGEKKRVCIAVEMISDPAVLILDEPTSGLDSSKAKSITKMLRNLAMTQKKTIIFTLHQPSFLIFQDLDRLLLLNQGRTIYQGKAEQIYDYMVNDLQIVVPLSSTLSDFFMMEISEYKNQRYDHKTLLNEESYNLKLKDRNEEEIQAAKKEITKEGFAELKFLRSFLFMFSMLMQREWTIFKRNPMKGVRVIANSLFSAFLVGLVFIRGISDNRPSIYQFQIFQRLEYYFIRVQGVYFVTMVSCIMSGIFSVSLAFPTDRQIYYKQTISKKYLPIAYLISKIIIEAGAVIVGTVVYGLAMFFFVGSAITFLQLLKFVIVLTACALVGNSLGILTGSLFKDAKRASALTPAFILPLMMFSGLYNKLGSIPKWIAWLQYLSPFRYGLHSSLLNEFQQQKYLTLDREVFDYRSQLAINLDYEWNIVVLLGLALLYYSVAFVLLKKLSSKLAP